MKLNQTELGKRVGVDRLSISNYENGKRQPTVEIFAALAKALHCSMSYLGGEFDYENTLDNDSAAALRAFDNGDVQTAMEIVRKRGRKKRNNG